MPSKMSVAVIAAIFLFACNALANGDGDGPRKLPGDEPFSVVKKTIDETKCEIQIRLGSGFVMPLGKITHHDPGRDTSKTGIDPGSICVHNIKGRTDLLHVEWTTFVQGSGNWEKWYYMVCCKSNPSIVFARGHFAICGKAGWDFRTCGNYSVSFENDDLCIKEHRWDQEMSEKPKPMYHREDDENGSIYVCSTETILAKTCKIMNQTAIYGSTVLEYKYHRGDDIEDVCKRLKIEREWIANIDLINKNATWMQVSIPESVSKDKFPMVDNTECE